MAVDAPVGLQLVVECVRWPLPRASLPAAEGAADSLPTLPRASFDPGDGACVGLSWRGVPTSAQATMTSSIV